MCCMCCPVCFRSDLCAIRLRKGPPHRRRQKDHFAIDAPSGTPERRRHVHGKAKPKGRQPPVWKDMSECSTRWTQSSTKQLSPKEKTETQRLFNIFFKSSLGSYVLQVSHNCNTATRIGMKTLIDLATG